MEIGFPPIRKQIDECHTPQNGFETSEKIAKILGIEKIQKSPTFTPAIVANIMIAEMVKLITKKPSALINKIMLIDLLNNQYKILFK